MKFKEKFLSKRSAKNNLSYWPGKIYAKFDKSDKVYYETEYDPVNFIKKNNQWYLQFENTIPQLKNMFNSYSDIIIVNIKDKKRRKIIWNKKEIDYPEFDLDTPVFLTLKSHQYPDKKIYYIQKELAKNYINILDLLSFFDTNLFTYNDLFNEVKCHFKNYCLANSFLNSYEFDSLNDNWPYNFQLIFQKVLENPDSFYNSNTRQIDLSSQNSHLPLDFVQRHSSRIYSSSNQNGDVIDLIINDLGHKENDFYKKVVPALVYSPQITKFDDYFANSNSLELIKHQSLTDMESLNPYLRSFEWNNVPIYTNGSLSLHNIYFTADHLTAILEESGQKVNYIELKKLFTWLQNYGTKLQIIYKSLEKTKSYIGTNLIIDSVITQVAKDYKISLLNKQ